jgi:hypothetical protein
MEGVGVGGNTKGMKNLQEGQTSAQIKKLTCKTDAVGQKRPKDREKTL